MLETTLLFPEELPSAFPQKRLAPPALTVQQLLHRVAALEQAARYVPVAEALPSKFNKDGWSPPLLVCTDGRVNVYPHVYIKSRKERPGYWLQLGSPHVVGNVTHWRAYPADPTATSGPLHSDAGKSGQ